MSDTICPPHQGNPCVYCGDGLKLEIVDRDTVDVLELERGKNAFSGQLISTCGSWRFKSSDDSIDWWMGDDLDAAIAELKARHHHKFDPLIELDDDKPASFEAFCTWEPCQAQLGWRDIEPASPWLHLAGEDETVHAVEDSTAHECHCGRVYFLPTLYMMMRDERFAADLKKLQFRPSGGLSTLRARKASKHGD